MAVFDKSASANRLRALADFRHHLRVFLQFSEGAATRSGLQPQQHQLLLQIAGAAQGVDATVGFAAERLGLRHHTVVQLSKRCADAGLVTRKHDKADRRRVVLELTPKGRRILEALSEDHARELNELAPQLIKTLSTLGPGRRAGKREAGKTSPGGNRES